MPAVKLFEPISFRAVTARNRIVVAPMCQYSANDGLGDDYALFAPGGVEVVPSTAFGPLTRAGVRLAARGTA